MSILKPKVNVVPYPTFVCKGIWAGTAVKYLIQARDEESAKEKCWNQITHTMGGDTCLSVQILEKREA